MLKDFSPEELSYLATTFAVTLTKGLDQNSIKVLCSFFVDVVGTLNLIINQRTLCEKPSAPLPPTLYPPILPQPPHPPHLPYPPHFSGSPGSFRHR